jgi:hypothetical protein
MLICFDSDGTVARDFNSPGLQMAQQITMFAFWAFDLCPAYTSYVALVENLEHGTYCKNFSGTFLSALCSSTKVTSCCMSGTTGRGFHVALMT